VAGVAKVVADHPLGRSGVDEPPQSALGVVLTTPYSRSGGGSATPQTLNFFFCFGFWAFGGGRTTPKVGWDGLSTPDRPKATPLTNNGVTGHPLGFFLF
jgi:hypothetical protein